MIVIEVDLDSKCVGEGNSSRSTNDNEKSKEVLHECFWEFLSQVGRTNLGVIKDDRPEQCILLSSSRDS